MTKATHNILWSFKAHKTDGTSQFLDCSKPFNPSEWDDPREAAIFFTFDSKDALAADGWHIGEPKEIKVSRIHPLSDAGLA